jgi:MOSC domain-containing protein YiiM
MAALQGIAWRAGKRAPMQTPDSAKVLVESGVAGDSRGRPGPRQVTVLASAGWDAACAQAGVELPWHTRRANLLVDGLDLAGTTGKQLRIGRLCLEVTGELEPCSRMDEACPGLREALIPQWRGGVTCRVVAAGEIAVGDPVTLEEPSD